MKCLLSVIFVLAAVGTTVDSAPSLKAFSTADCTGTATLAVARPTVDECQANTADTTSEKHLAIEGGMSITGVGVYMAATGAYTGTCAGTPNTTSSIACGQCDYSIDSKFYRTATCDAAAGTAEYKDGCNSDCSACTGAKYSLSIGGCDKSSGSYGLDVQYVKQGSVAPTLKYKNNTDCSNLGEKEYTLCNDCVDVSALNITNMKSYIYDCETAAPTVVAHVNPDEVTAGAAAHFAGMLVALVVLLATAF